MTTAGGLTEPDGGYPDLPPPGPAQLPGQRCRSLAGGNQKPGRSFPAMITTIDAAAAKDTVTGRA
jgi:hypothetical protein